MSNPYENIKISLAAAITSLNSSARYRYEGDNGGDISTLQWLDDTTPISNVDILAEQKRLQDIEDAK
tara:strand:+ start:534 stop:734 length:201 start_codon:yes stop_codon:yes gene_type:complete